MAPAAPVKIALQRNARKRWRSEWYTTADGVLLEVAQGDKTEPEIGLTTQRKRSSRQSGGHRPNKSRRRMLPERYSPILSPGTPTRPAIPARDTCLTDDQGQGELGEGKGQEGDIRCHAAGLTGMETIAATSTATMAPRTIPSHGETPKRTEGRRWCRRQSQKRRCARN